MTIQEIEKRILELKSEISKLEVEKERITNKDNLIYDVSKERNELLDNLFCSIEKAWLRNNQEDFKQKCIEIDKRICYPMGVGEAAYDIYYEHFWDLKQGKSVLLNRTKMLFAKWVQKDVLEVTHKRYSGLYNNKTRELQLRQDEIMEVKKLLSKRIDEFYSFWAS